MPAIFGGLFLAAIIHCLWRYYRDFNRMLDVLRGVKPELIEKSLYPISKGVKQEKLNKGSSQLAKTSNLVYKILPLALLFYLSVQCMLLCVGFLTSTTALEESDWLGRWFVLAEERQCAISFLTAAIASVAVIPSDLGLSDTLFNLIEAQMEILAVSRQDLLVGDQAGDQHGIIGFDADLDAMQLTDVCTGVSYSSLALSRCLSMDRAIGATAVVPRAVRNNSHFDFFR
jgi:hypothetical protein